MYYSKTYLSHRYNNIQYISRCNVVGFLKSLKHKNVRGNSIVLRKTSFILTFRYGLIFLFISAEK